MLVAAFPQPRSFLAPYSAPSFLSRPALPRSLPYVYAHPEPSTEPTETENWDDDFESTASVSVSGHDDEQQDDHHGHDELHHEYEYNYMKQRRERELENDDEEENWDEDFTSSDEDEDGEEIVPPSRTPERQAAPTLRSPTSLTSPPPPSSYTLPRAPSSPTPQHGPRDRNRTPRQRIRPRGSGSTITGRSNGGGSRSTSSSTHTTPKAKTPYPEHNHGHGSTSAPSSNSTSSEESGFSDNEDRTVTRRRQQQHQRSSVPPVPALPPFSFSTMQVGLGLTNAGFGVQTPRLDRDAPFPRSPTASNTVPVFSLPAPPSPERERDMYSRRSTEAFPSSETSASASASDSDDVEDWDADLEREGEEPAPQGPHPYFLDSQLSSSPSRAQPQPQTNNLQLGLPSSFKESGHALLARIGSVLGRKKSRSLSIAGTSDDPHLLRPSSRQSHRSRSRSRDITPTSTHRLSPSPFPSPSATPAVSPFSTPDKKKTPSPNSKTYGLLGLGRPSPSSNANGSVESVSVSLKKASGSSAGSALIKRLSSGHRRTRSGVSGTRTADGDTNTNDNGAATSTQSLVVPSKRASMLVTKSGLVPMQYASLGRVTGSPISPTGPAVNASAASTLRRNNSLSDITFTAVPTTSGSGSGLKIPARITQAQDALRRDLEMVREFAGVVQELKTLKETYAALLTRVEDVLLQPPHTSNVIPAPAPTPSAKSIFLLPSRRKRANTTASAESSEHVHDAEHTLARAVRGLVERYRVDWECADLLIELGTGEVSSPVPASTSATATPAASEEGTATTTKRERRITFSDDGAGPTRPGTASSLGRNGTGQGSDLSSRQLGLLREMLGSSTRASSGASNEGLPESFSPTSTSASSGQDREWRGLGIGVGRGASRSTVTLVSMSDASSVIEEEDDEGEAEENSHVPVEKTKSKKGKSRSRLRMLGIREMLRGLVAHTHGKEKQKDGTARARHYRLHQLPVNPSQPTGVANAQRATRALPALYSQSQLLKAAASTTTSAMSTPPRRPSLASIFHIGHGHGRGGKQRPRENGNGDDECESGPATATMRPSSRNGSRVSIVEPQISPHMRERAPSRASVASGSGMGRLASVEELLGASGSPPSFSPTRSLHQHRHRRQTGSVRSIPPSLSGLSQGGSATSAPTMAPGAAAAARLAMTPENIKPLLENARVVRKRLSDCVEGMRALLVPVPVGE
ncbi:hypothetical protein HMN09_00705200 [Mycena chlorophos]|uniref:Uncharacterized protein n=1 Tax=Mycena chlorophos TaxID=658473 RepID=A0A8H6T1K1_MYCCL|nr:hypothetical protein HMN09_00705200 [Mycena chlorophos]